MSLSLRRGSPMTLIVPNKSDCTVFNWYWSQNPTWSSWKLPRSGSKWSVELEKALYSWEPSQEVIFRNLTLFISSTSLNYWRERGFYDRVPILRRRPFRTDRLGVDREYLGEARSSWNWIRHMLGSLEMLLLILYCCICLIDLTNRLQRELCCQRMGESRRATWLQRLQKHTG